MTFLFRVAASAKQPQEESLDLLSDKKEQEAGKRRWTQRRRLPGRADVLFRAYPGLASASSKTPQAPLNAETDRG